MDTTRILLVDDDPDLRDLCSLILRQGGYSVDAVPDGETAMERLELESYQLALLDWNLPGIQGRSLLEAVGWRWPELPIIIITGYSDEDKAVAAVEYAQAYLRKPFEKQVLLDAVGRVLHRVTALRSGDFPAVTRPTPAHPMPSPLTPGDSTSDEGAAQAPLRHQGVVEINPLRCEARIGDSPPVALTATEYAMLNHLYIHAGEVVPHKALARLLSIRPLSAKESAALCKHHIRSLRAKLEPDAAHPTFIMTVWGQGYRLIPNGK